MRIGKGMNGKTGKRRKSIFLTDCVCFMYGM